MRSICLQLVDRASGNVHNKANAALAVAWQSPSGTEGRKMAVGKCGHCGFEPVAASAKTCPQCNGEDPILASANATDWMKGIGIAVVAVVVIVGGAIVLM
jgi:hypothetical protein